MVTVLIVGLALVSLLAGYCVLRRRDLPKVQEWLSGMGSIGGPKAPVPRPAHMNGHAKKTLPGPTIRPARSPKPTTDKSSKPRKSRARRAKSPTEG